MNRERPIGYDFSQDVEKVKTNGVCPLDKSDCWRSPGGSTREGTRCNEEEVEIVWLRIAQCRSYGPDLY